MSTVAPNGITIVSCGVLTAEIGALKDRDYPACGLRFLTSMLHMQPGCLGASLQSVLDEELKLGHSVVLIYGDCCPQMTELSDLPRVARIRAANCCEMLLGHDGCRKLSREGVFFLLPEWALRWREIFTKELGLNQTNATGIMRDMHTKLVYLDTGLVPVPHEELRQCSEYCGLPYEILPVTLETFCALIDEAVRRLQT